MVARMSELPSPSEIQSEMRRIRQSLRADVEELVNDVTEIVDWRYQFQARPLFWCSVALAAGYWLIPRKQDDYDVRRVLENISEKQPIVLVGHENGTDRRWLPELVNLIGSAAMRQVASHGIAAATQILPQLFSTNGRNRNQPIDSQDMGASDD
jgi:hypothetical protein